MTETRVPSAYRYPSTRLPHSIGFRPITDADLEFLERLYRSTREDELASTPWSEDEKTSFVAFQFKAQHQYYQEQFATADFLLVVDAETPIGRIYLDRREDELRLIDIILVPERRRSGLGTQLLEDLLDEARARELPVRIHVEQFNPAMQLYLRLGFKPVQDQGVYQLMEWRP